jgi:hypothetical protein
MVNYFILTRVKWTVGYMPQGGNLLEEVSVGKGDTKQVLLTDKNFVGR